MKPNLIKFFVAITLAVWILPIWMAYLATWKAQEWSRLVDTANAQTELALKWKHEQHKKP